jgi:GT2 family glycosyltransferase
MSTPAISIVMPCFNARQHLPRSVGSVQAQTFTDWELIAIDDGSSDGTRAWLDAVADPRVRLLGQPNRGVCVARNVALQAAQAPLVAFLDADDTWSPEFLAEMHEALRLRPYAVLAYCGWQNVGLPGPRGEPYVPPDHETGRKLEELLAACRWPIHACLTRREAITAAGGFDPRFRTSEDYLLWLKLAKDRPIVRVPQVLAQYHFHGNGQATADKARVALNHWRAQRAFLADHPADAARLPAALRHRLTTGLLLQRGLECHWRRELGPARTIFRRLLAGGHAPVAHWNAMLPALLPLAWHRWLLRGRDGTGRVPR